MPRKAKPSLTKLELQMMQVIWRRGESTVTHVKDGLEQQLAYTTVQTMLNILERKAQLKRRLEGRAFVYAADVTRKKLPARPSAISSTACSAAPAKSLS